MKNIQKTILILLLASASICNYTRTSNPIPKASNQTPPHNCFETSDVVAKIKYTEVANFIKGRRNGFQNDYSSGMVEGFRQCPNDMQSNNDNINTAISTIFSFAVAPWGASFGDMCGKRFADGIIELSPAVKPYEKYIQGICRGTGIVLGAFTAQQVSYRLTNRIYRAIDARQQVPEYEHTVTIELPVVPPEPVPPTTNTKKKSKKTEEYIPLDLTPLSRDWGGIEDRTETFDVITKINNHIVPSPWWVTGAKIVAPVVIYGGIGVATGKIRFVQAPGASNWTMGLGFNVTL